MLKDSKLLVLVKTLIDDGQGKVLPAIDGFRTLIQNEQ